MRQPILSWNVLSAEGQKTTDFCARWSFKKSASWENTDPPSYLLLQAKDLANIICDSLLASDMQLAYRNRSVVSISHLKKKKIKKIRLQVNFIG